MRCDQDLIGAGQFGQRDDIHPRLHDLADLLILHVQDRLDHAPLARLDAFRARGRLQSRTRPSKVRALAGYLLYMNISGELSFDLLFQEHIFSTGTDER